MTLKIIETTGDDKLANVFIGQTNDGACIEFVESVQPPVPRDQKWVLIVSTLKGCPVKCPICDAGGNYRGKLSKEEILAQIAYLVDQRFPNGRIPIPMVKIQFARMGDPAFNNAVLDVLNELPSQYHMPGLFPSISTVAPKGSEKFISQLKEIKNRLYGNGRFQMQFSVHTTDDAARRRLVPINTLELNQMAAIGNDFFAPGDRKITLNFAPAKGLPLDEQAIARHFSPEKFIIKLTPINPTFASAKAGLEGIIDPADTKSCDAVVNRFKSVGFDTILSIGELKENAIGSNCGMYVTKMQQHRSKAS